MRTQGKAQALPTPQASADKEGAELFVLLPYQQRWVADPAPVRIAEKSRRVGLSWASACEAVMVSARATKPMDAWYVGYNADMAREFIRDAANWARHLHGVAVEFEELVLEEGDKAIQAFRITFASGKRITALSSRPSNLRGKQGLVILDEAAFHHDLAELIKAAIALLMWGGRVCIISTHDGVGNPFNTLIQEVRARKKPYSLHRITLDEALAEGLYQRICLATSKTWSPEAEAAWRQELVDFYGDAANEELFCVPRDSSGAFIARSLVEARMAGGEVLRLTFPGNFAEWTDAARVAWMGEWMPKLTAALAALPAGAQGWVGGDFGRSGDLTVFGVCLADQRLHRSVPLLVELRNAPFREQQIILNAICAGIPRLMGLAFDATGIGAPLAEAAAERWGWSRVAQVKFSETWYREELPPLKADLEDGGLTLVKDADLLADFGDVQVVNGTPRPVGKRRAGADGKARHADAAVAVLLAHFASRAKAVAPIEGLTTGDERVGAGLDDWLEMA